MAKNEGFDLGAMLAGLDIVPNSGTGREQIEYITLDIIDDDSENFYETKGIEELAANIALFGLMDPLRIREDPEKPGRYKVTSGHRRRLALKALQKDDPEKYAEAPCIIDQVMQSPALQELKLIFANKDNRKYSPADLDEEAQRVEKLLYQLKEEGYEFPGRMRDHVAAAVNASKSKLSRLKVIREKLDKVWQLSFKVDKLNEAAAYALAKLPAEWQRVIYYGTRDKTPGVVSGICSISEVTVDHYRKAFERIKDIQCSIDRGLCSHRSVMMEKTVKVPYILDACQGCCLDCDKLARCGSSCFRADDKKRAMNQQRKAVLAEEKAVAKAQTEADEALIATTYKRARDARERANVEAKELLLIAGINPLMDKFYTDYETGKAAITKGTSLAYLNQVSIEAARQLLAVSEKLGCSIDWLLGREVSGPGEMQNAECKMQNVPELGTAEEAEESQTEPTAFSAARSGWMTGEPEEDGRYAVLTSGYTGGRMFGDICDWKDGKWWGLMEDEVVRYWMSMPEDGV